MIENAKDVEQRALTLAVICVEQRVEALRKEWRGLSQRQQEKQPGLEDQLDDEKQALRWLERRRNEAYR
jgi:alpha/beta superfamily hydrolase